MRGQPGKKVGCSDRRRMLEESSIALLREERETVLICIYRVMCTEEMMWISWSRSGWSRHDERLGNCNKPMLNFEKHDESCYSSLVHQCFPLQLL